MSQMLLKHSAMGNVLFYPVVHVVFSGAYSQIDVHKIAAKKSVVDPVEISHSSFHVHTPHRAPWRKDGIKI